MGNETADRPVGWKMRKRQLKDLVDQACLYSRHKLLTKLPNNHDSYFLQAAIEFSIVGAVSVHGAKRVLKLLNIRDNSLLWTYFDNHIYFRVFTAAEFAVPSTVNKPDVEMIHNFTSRKGGRDGSLANLSLSFRYEVRDRLVLWHFQLAGVFATLAGWTKGEFAANCSALQAIFLRYIAPSWNSVTMYPQTDDVFCINKMSTGWHLVDVVMVKFIKSLKGEITLSILQAKLPELVSKGIIAFVTWFYGQKPQLSNAEDFVRKINLLVNNVRSKMFRDLSICPTASADPTSSAECTGDSIDPSMILEALCEAHYGTPSIQDIEYCWDDLTARDKRTGNIIMEQPEATSNDAVIPETPIESPLQVVEGTPRPASPSLIADSPLSTVRQGPRLNRLRISGKRLHYLISTAVDKIVQQESRGTVRSNTRRRSISGEEGTTLERVARAKRTRFSFAENANTAGDDGLRKQVGFARLWEFQAAGSSAKPLPDSPTPVIELTEERLEIEVESNGLTLELPQQTSCDAMEENTPGQRALRRDLEEFYAESLRWTMLPNSSCQDNIADTQANREWFLDYARKHQSEILQDVTSSRDVVQYSTHWKRILQMELRGKVADEANAKFPKMTESTHKFKDLVHGSHYAPKFIRVVIQNMSYSRLLANFRCESSDKLLNKKILSEMRGMTLAVAYLKRASGAEDSTNLRLLLVRRVHADNEDFDQVGITGNLDKVTLSVAMERGFSWSFRPEQGDFIFLQTLCTIAPIARMFIAAHLVYKIPKRIQDIIFGERNPQEAPRPELVKVSEAHDIIPLISAVDHGCMQYIRRLRVQNIMNEHQFQSLVIVLHEIGGAGKNSSSLSMILGPPGTGKTTTIVLLIGALLHHSEYGHVGRQTHNLLSREDGIQRSSKANDALKILVCAGSNQAVDNCLRKLAEGIPDGFGGRIFVQVVRVARQEYEFKDLETFSMNERALVFDHEHFHKTTTPIGSDFTPRTNASLQARKALSREVIVFFYTNTLSGGSQFSELKMSCDVVINDEVSAVHEPQGLIPMVATRKHNSLSRLHYVGVGDFNQLPGPSSVANYVRLGNLLLHFCYDKQVVSQFERLDDNNRCPRSILLQQYRMHPVISMPHSKHFYGGIIKDGASVKNFIAPYNSLPNLGKGFFPLTFWDTCLCRSRTETNDDEGNITNLLEARLVYKSILQLIRLSSEAGENIQEKIAVIAPYRAQVNVIRETITEGMIRHLGIVVDTVDTMQGAEREIILFSSTRSNNTGNVGFLHNRKRLNVAVSRAKKLLLVIGDSETLFNSRSLAFLISWCRDRRSGAGLIMVRPEPGDELAHPITRGGSMNLYRRQGGYNLRSRGEATSSEFTPDWLKHQGK